MACNAKITAACGNYNLCVGLPAGIKGAVHAIQQELDDKELYPLPLPLPPADDKYPMDLPATQDDKTLGNAPPGEDVKLLLLVDACNSFNKLGRKAMFWTVRHQWPSGARFAFNRYCHWSTLVVQCPISQPTCSTPERESCKGIHWPCSSMAQPQYPWCKRCAGMH